jgi:hypothetical protein
LKRDPSDEEVKTVVDVEVSSIMEKKDLKRDKDKMLVCDSSDDEFLRSTLTTLRNSSYGARRCLS